MQSFEHMRDDFSFLPISTNSDTNNFETESDVRDVFDSAYFSGSWDKELDSIKELVVDTDNSYIPQLVPKHQGVKPQSASIFHKLKDLYHEEIQQSNVSDLPEARQTSCLLDKLVQRESFNMVILTLFNVAEGYSLTFSSVNGETFQESRFPYTKDTILDYINREQLPTPFLDCWEKLFPQLFYDGCVIAQVRDLRHGYPAHVQHVLLKPHNQSLISDVNKLILDSDRLWTPEEQFSVECNVINNTQRSLCLDPNPEAGKRMLKLHQDHHAFDTNSIRNLLHRNSQLVQHRKRKYEHLLNRPNQFLSDFIASKRAASSLNKPNASFVPENEMKTVLNRSQKFPNSKDILCEVNRLAKPLESEPDSCDFTPKLIEEWILETDRSSSTTFHIRLSILQRPVNLEYLGQLYVDKEYKEGQSNGSSCIFTLGTRANAYRYVKQFTEIFTEEGRESVKITHLVPGQPAQVTSTPGLIERERATSANMKIMNQPRKKILQVLSLILN